jgi:hypothetical protein
MGMKTKYICRRVAALLMVLLLIPSAAFAQGEKNLTVDASAAVEEGLVYPDIQSAIDYIAAQTEKTGWTITVNSGDYARFTVLDGLDGLTVAAAQGAQVRISVADNSAAPSPVSGGHPDTGGVSIRSAQNVVLEGLQFVVGTQTAPWYAAGVSTHSDTSSKGSALVLRGCTFTGSGMGIGLFIGTGTDAFTVESCGFSGLREAISMYGDGVTVEAISVTGNQFRDCAFAIHGYYGGGPDAGTLVFSGNTVSGSETLRCKIVLQDQVNSGAMRVDIRDNSLENAIVGLVNLREEGETVSDVLRSNLFGENCHYVEAVEPGTIDFYTSYRVPQGTQGRWVLTGIEDLGLDPETTEMIVQQLEQANASQDHTLNISSLPDGTLIRTFTWFKDAIYWESADVGSLTVKKTVVNESGFSSGPYGFVFIVQLDDHTISGTYGDMEFTDGMAMLRLRDGESATASGLPAGVGYTVKEQFTPGYSTSAEGDEGVIEKDKTAQASFINIRRQVIVPDDDVSITVRKVWVLDDGAMRPDSVSVGLLRGGVLYDTVILNEDNGWQYTWDELDGDYSWSIGELDVPEGFTVTVDKRGSVYTITNDDIPVVPEEPDEPEVPEQPDTPENPEEPDVPVQPEEPTEPAVPNTGIRRSSGYWIAGMAVSAATLLLLIAAACAARRRGKETD